MHTEHLYEHRVLNIVQTAILLVGMSAVLGLLGYVLAGLEGAVWIIMLIVPIILLSPRISSRLVLRLYGAQPLPRTNAFPIDEMIRKLSAKAGLSCAPKIYYLPTHRVTIFTVGQKSDATIVISIGFMELFDRRETGGIIAHEIAHIKNNDLWIMSIADFISRVTGLLSVIGLVFLMLLLPLLIVSGNIGTMLAALVIVTFAPYFNILLQLALSRVREYRADITAAYLMGEALPLARALKKIESAEQHWLDQLLFPGRAIPVPSLFRTHPSTHERIKRLQQLTLPDDVTPLFPHEHPRVPITLLPLNSHKRDFFRGLWF